MNTNESQVNHFGINSDSSLSIPPYYTNHQQILLAFLSKNWLTRISSLHFLHYHSSPISHLPIILKKQQQQQNKTKANCLWDLFGPNRVVSPRWTNWLVLIPSSSLPIPFPGGGGRKSLMCWLYKPQFTRPQKTKT